MPTKRDGKSVSGVDRPLQAKRLCKCPLMQFILIYVPGDKKLTRERSRASRGWQVSGAWRRLETALYHDALADITQGVGDRPCRRLTSEHVAHVAPSRPVSRHIRKVPAEERWLKPLERLKSKCLESRFIYAKFLRRTWAYYSWDGMPCTKMIDS